MSVVRPQSFPSHIHAAFTGARKPPDFHGDRFTFDLHGDAEGEDSVASRLWLLGHCGFQAKAWRDVEQVHGDRCIEQRSSEPSRREKADALWTTSESLVLAIRTADCVPVLITSSSQPLAVAIHAGWRGTYQQIVSKSLRQILEVTQIHPDSLVAAIGPCIHSNAFEVDADVAGPFETRFGYPVVQPTPGKDQRWNVDLVEANRQELAAMGIPADKIEVMDECTFSNHDYWSFRRQRKAAGRQVAWISLTGR